jgi:hypothetical protein
VEKFGMTPILREDKGEGSSGDTIVIFRKQDSGESPLLPSPNIHKKHCHPETHPPLGITLKQWL